MAWRPDYCTVEQLANFLNIDDTVDNAELATAITAASRAIDRCCKRQFGQVEASETRTYSARWSRTRRVWYARVDDLPTAEGLALTIGGTAVTDFTLGPRNSVQDGKVFTELVLGPAAEARPTAIGDPIDLTSDQFGWLGVPNTVLQAAKLQGGRFHKRRNALFGVAGSPSDGSEVRLLDKVDPDVAVMLGFYARQWWAA